MHVDEMYNLFVDNAVVSRPRQCALWHAPEGLTHTVMLGVRHLAKGSLAELYDLLTVNCDGLILYRVARLLRELNLIQGLRKLLLNEYSFIYA